jgi:hypothetical protein
MPRAPIDKQLLYDVAASVNSHQEFQDYFGIAPPTLRRWKAQYNLKLPDARHTRQDANWITARRIDIRNRRNAGETFQSIADDYNVSRQMVYNIYRRDKLRLAHEAVNT